MTRLFNVKILLISTLLLLSGLLVWNLNQKEETINSSQKVQRDKTIPLKMEGLSHSTHDQEGRLLSKITADELVVNPRKFFVFNIKSINEITITNARISFYIYEDMAASYTDLISLSQSIVPFNNADGASNSIGRITRGVMNELTIEVYKEGELSISIKTRSGVVDFRKKIVKMKDVRIEEKAVRRIIKTNSAIWDNSDNIIKIPGEYAATTPKGTDKGYGFKIDLIPKL